jgi:hypothetical protein
LSFRLLGTSVGTPKISVSQSNGNYPREISEEARDKLSQAAAKEMMKSQKT